MSKLVITETMRAILVYMGSWPNESFSLTIINAAFSPVPKEKLLGALDGMSDESLLCQFGDRVKLTSRGKVVAAKIIKLTTQ